MNLRAPVISHVCSESRAVAFETGGFPRYQYVPPGAYWTSGNLTINNAWEDPVRDAVHLNWNPAYKADLISNGSPLHRLVWIATRMRRGSSMMISFLADSPHQDIPVSRRIDALWRLPSWVIVVGVVVIHVDFGTAAATGLFGLLGDAPLQIVDISDRARVNALFNLGDKSEGRIVEQLEEPMYNINYVRPNDRPDRRYVLTSQDLRSDSIEAIEQRFRDVIVKTFGSEEAVPPMRPAIMFRLCNLMCNPSDDREDGPSATSTQSRGGRGRGRGRGGELGRGRGTPRGGGLSIGHRPEGH